jgi:hypothetical protein
VVLDNIWSDTDTVDYKSSSAKQKVAESLDDVFPVLVAGQIINTNIEIHEF